LENNSLTRAAGTVQPDGSFALETLYEGVIYQGAQEGSYIARLVPGDDGDKEARRLRNKAIPQRYRQLGTSGLSFQVPASGEVVLRLTSK